LKSSSIPPDAVSISTPILTKGSNISLKNLRITKLDTHDRFSNLLRANELYYFRPSDASDNWGAQTVRLGRNAELDDFSTVYRASVIVASVWDEAQYAVREAILG